MACAEFVFENWQEEEKSQVLEKLLGNMDPVADMLTQIMNALAVKKTSLSLPYSKMKFGIAKILVENGYLENLKVFNKGAKKFLRIELKYDQKGEPLIQELRRISKPGRRIYVKKKEIKSVKSGLGFWIISTPQGLMTSIEAKKKGLGGEVICEVF